MSLGPVSATKNPTWRGVSVDSRRSPITRLGWIRGHAFAGHDLELPYDVGGILCFARPTHLRPPQRLQQRSQRPAAARRQTSLSETIVALSGSQAGRVGELIFGSGVIPMTPVCCLCSSNFCGLRVRESLCVGGDVMCVASDSGSTDS